MYSNRSRPLVSDAHVQRPAYVVYHLNKHCWSNESKRKTVRKMPDCPSSLLQRVFCLDEHRAENWSSLRVTTKPTTVPNRSLQVWWRADVVSSPSTCSSSSSFSSHRSARLSSWTVSALFLGMWNKRLKWIARNVKRFSGWLQRRERCRDDWWIVRSLVAAQSVRPLREREKNMLLSSSVNFLHWTWLEVPPCY